MALPPRPHQPAFKTQPHPNHSVETVYARTGSHVSVRYLAIVEAIQLNGRVGGVS